MGKYTELVTEIVKNVGGKDNVNSLTHCVTLPRIKLFIMTCVGAAITGGYLGMTGCLYYALTGLGIFTIPGFIGGSMAPTTIMLHVLVSLVLGMAFTFVSCWMLYKGEEKK